MENAILPLMPGNASDEACPDPRTTIPATRIPAIATVRKDLDIDRISEPPLRVRNNRNGILFGKSSLAPWFSGIVEVEVSSRLLSQGRLIPGLPNFLSCPTPRWPYPQYFSRVAE